MSALSELNEMISALRIAVETGVFSARAPDEYVVITPLADVFEVHADNRPQFETQEARLSLFSKNNYRLRVNQITRTLLNAEFAITERRYIGYEADTGYHHYAIDVAKDYELEDE